MWEKRRERKRHRKEVIAGREKPAPELAVSDRQMAEILTEQMHRMDDTELWHLKLALRKIKRKFRESSEDRKSWYGELAKLYNYFFAAGTGVLGYHMYIMPQIIDLFGLESLIVGSVGGVKIYSLFLRYVFGPIVQRPEKYINRIDSLLKEIDKVRIERAQTKALSDESSRDS